MFDLADTLAAAVQRTEQGDPWAWLSANPSAPDSRRAAGSRAHGLHWACVWIEARVQDEDTTPERELDGALAAPPFEVLPLHLLHEARRTARIAEARVLRAPEPCPWCEGELTLHSAPDGPPTASAASSTALWHRHPSSYQEALFPYPAPTTITRSRQAGSDAVTGSLIPVAWPLGHEIVERHRAAPG
ncbi:hypothetical protein [Streptomyces sp. NPDC059761]|uniref:hypothetical protein n=1 Tax=Streptomyces sp. NPDC059761 TaxID=3346937 RepID=UPI0036462E70